MAGCLNGGSCLFDKEKDAFACSCNPQWSGEKCELGKFLLFFVPYNKYRIVKEVHSLLAPGIPNTMETLGLKQYTSFPVSRKITYLSVSGKCFSGTKKVKLLTDCQFNEPSTL